MKARRIFLLPPMYLCAMVFGGGCTRQMVDLSVSQLSKSKDVGAYRVAVLDFDFKPESRNSTSAGSVTRPQNAGGLVADMVSNKLVGCGMQIVERSRLRRILDEQDLSQSDLLTDKHRTRIGKLLNANVILVGTLSEFATAHWSGGFSGWVSFTARGVDVETGEVLFTIVASDDRTFMDSSGVAALLMDAMGKKLKAEMRR